MYRVVDWERHFENNRTRELKTLTWVPFPNKHDGDGYTELLDHPDGPAHYGAWCAIAQVASKCEPRGTLVRDGARPHTAASLARMTHFPESIMAAAIERLVVQIKWLEIVPDPEGYEDLAAIPQESATAPQSPASRVRAQEGKGREGKGTEGKGMEEEDCGEASSPPPAATTPAVMVFPCNGPGAREWPLDEAKLAEYRESFPGIDVLAQCRAARQWCIDNPARRKTPRGMPAFLTRWLTREQNKAASATKSNGDPRGNMGQLREYLAALEVEP